MYSRPDRRDTCSGGGAMTPRGLTASSTKAPTSKYRESNASSVVLTGKPKGVVVHAMRCTNAFSPSWLPSSPGCGTGRSTVSPLRPS